jgi:hypothetical protein
MSEIILPDGIVFGCQPRETEPGAVFRSASAAGVEPLPRSKWQDWDLSSVVGTIYNQGRTGSCVGQGSAKACEMATRLTGATVGTLNGFVVYANCFSGRVSWSSGTALENGLQALRDIGAPEVSDDFPAEATTRWPSDWKARCAQHRVTEFVDFDGDAERVFALIWTMGQKFGMPSIMGASRCWGGGHCTAVSGGRYSGGKAYLNGPNSWGDSWSNCGRPGFWEFAEAKLSDLDRMGCWGCTVTTEPTR